MKLKTKLDNINKRLTALVAQRDEVLREFRKQCQHLRIVELDAYPPQRICVECGAEEQGWHCGYQVLFLNGERRTTNETKRFLLERTNDVSRFYKYRQHGPYYGVGQNHPNFERIGPGHYEQLTEVLK